MSRPRPSSEGPSPDAFPKRARSTSEYGRAVDALGPGALTEVEQAFAELDQQQREQEILQSKPCDEYFNFASGETQSKSPDANPEAHAYFRARNQQTGRVTCMDVERLLDSDRFLTELRRVPGSYLVAQALREKLELERQRARDVRDAVDRTSREEREKLRALEAECSRRREEIAQAMADARASVVSASTQRAQQALQDYVHKLKYAKKFPTKPEYEDSLYVILGDDPEEVAKYPLQNIIQPTPELSPGDRRTYATSFLKTYTNQSDANTLQENIARGMTLQDEFFRSAVPLRVAAGVWRDAFERGELGDSDFRLARLRKQLLRPNYVDIAAVFTALMSRYVADLAKEFNTLTSEINSQVEISTVAEGDDVARALAEVDRLTARRQQLRSMLRCAIEYYIREKRWPTEQYVEKNCRQSGLETD